jgi:hypothetical protein
MGSQARNVIDYDTKKFFFYLVSFRVSYAGQKFYDGFYVAVRSQGVHNAKKDSLVIANKHLAENYPDGAELKMLRWDRFDHRPRNYNCVVTKPVLKTK